MVVKVFLALHILMFLLIWRNVHSVWSKGCSCCVWSCWKTSWCLILYVSSTEYVLSVSSSSTYISYKNDNYKLYLNLDSDSGFFSAASVRLKSGYCQIVKSHTQVLAWIQHRSITNISTSGICLYNEINRIISKYPFLCGVIQQLKQSSDFPCLKFKQML